MKVEKQKYISPLVEVIQMENEGNVMTASLPTPGDGGSGFRNSGIYRKTSRGYNSASGSDLEDLINDILTVEQ